MKQKIIILSFLLIMPVWNLTQLHAENVSKIVIEDHLSLDDLDNMSIEELIFASEQGNAAASFELGMRYFVDSNSDEALNWLSKADEQGHPEAKSYMMQIKMFDDFFGSLE